MAQTYEKKEGMDKYGIDINTIDFDWVKNTGSKKLLTKGYRAIKDDGHYPELEHALAEKLSTVDPDFARRYHTPHATQADKKAASKEIENFLDDIGNQQKKIRTPSDMEQFKRQKAAEDDRMKGNEFIKSREYKEAVRSYENSLKLNPTESATYCNRALAYLRLKEYKKVITDCNMAIKYNPDYSKAYNRRAEAKQQLGELSESYKDLIIARDLEHGDKKTEDELQKKIDTLSKILEEKGVPLPSPSMQEKFTRVVIDEESDSDSDNTEELRASANADANTKEAGSAGVLTGNMIIENKSNNQTTKSTESTKSTKSTKSSPPKQDIWGTDEVEITQLGETNVVKNVEDIEITPLGNMNMKKEATNMEKEKHFSKFESLKQSAISEYKTGQFDKALEEYRECLEKLEDLKMNNAERSLGINGEEYLNRKMGIYNNMAASYTQKHDENNIIKFTSKVIEESDEPRILTRAYLRRGMAYERIDNLLLAKKDMTRLKELEPANIEASKALTRLNTAIIKEQTSHLDQALEEIQPQLKLFKEKGNSLFKKGEYLKAIDEFSKGISIFEEKITERNLIKNLERGSVEIVWQLYSNRALMNIKLARYMEVFDDCSNIIHNIDSKNSKAFYRRGQALFHMNDCKRAIQDYEESLKLESGEDMKEKIKEDLKKALDRAVQLTMRKESKGNTSNNEIEEKKFEGSKKKVIRGEEGVRKGDIKKEEIGDIKKEEIGDIKKEEIGDIKKEEIGDMKKEEIGDMKKEEIGDMKKEEIPEKGKVSKGYKTPNVKEEYIKKATEKATVKLGEEYLSTPASPYKFESDYKSLKEDLHQFYLYIKRILPQDFQKLFADDQLSPELLMPIVRTFNLHGLQEKELLIDYMHSFCKTKLIHLTISFLSRKEKQDIKTLLETLEKDFQPDNTKWTLIKKIFG